jgi:hypothetical protein
MEESIIIEWGYAPENFFEGPIKVQNSDYCYTIENGKVTLIIKKELFEKDPNIKDSINKEIEGYFLGAQTFYHKSFKLDNSSLLMIYPDEKKNLIISVESGVLCHFLDTVDLIQKNAKGNIIHDSKAARVKSAKEFCWLAAKYLSRDEVAKAILNSYKSAVADPDNEFVHLYEIGESLVSHFGNSDLLRKALKVSKGEWKRFGYLANEAPLLEGRHRGKRPGKLRKATPIELKETRDTSKKLISSYLTYLDAK